MPHYIHFVSRGDEGYPKLLREISDPPAGFHRIGDYAFGGTCVAVVGTRRMTPYGRAVATALGCDLARLGFCVVSGMALGIDAAAHEGALSAGGKTVAVLGCGVDVIYPRENTRLYHRIAESGAILSEYAPGHPPAPFTFIQRNRIVSGSCAATVVVESDVDGGAMVTARLAGEQGRTVFAVPGRIDQSTSAGCHQLIRDGATLLTSVDDILNDLSFLGGLLPAPIPPKPGMPDPRRFNLTDDENRLLDSFAGGGALDPDSLAAETGIAAGRIVASLAMLELKGLIARRPDGSYEAV